MITFLTYIIVISVGIAACVWLTVVGLILARLAGYSPTRYALPPPDKASERMHDQQYFDRAIGKK
jgi:hypothetical protein